RLYEESSRIYLPDGLPPPPPYQGVVKFFELGNLANTLEQLATAGSDDFYKGEIADRLVRDIADIGGIIDRKDMENCSAEIRDAPTIRWRNSHLVHTAGGLTAAPTLEQVVRDMEPCQINGEKPGPEWFTTLANVLKN